MKTALEPAMERSRDRALHSFVNTAAAIAVSLLSWTFPRIGFLKFSELFAILAAPRAFFSAAVLRPLMKCYAPFVVATLYSFGLALFMTRHGDEILTGSKALYSSAGIVPFVTLLRIGIYLLSVAGITAYFALSPQENISKTLRWAYCLTVLPGLLQIFRIYSHIHFNIPYFERADVGPFSGVYNAGYLRVLGFELEPLAYATSVITVSCLSMFNGRRFPWLGILVLIHTYGAGAIAGLTVALVIALSRILTRLFVFLYLAAFVAVGWWITANIHLFQALALTVGSVVERVAAYYASISMWLDHPLGVGLGLYGYFFNHYDVIGYAPAQSLDWYPNNDPAMFLVYGGPLFLAAYLYTFWFVLRRSRSYWLTVAAVALLIQSISSYLYFNPAIIVVFSMLLANAAPIPRPPAGKRLIRLGPLWNFPFGVRFRIPVRPQSRVPAEATLPSRSAPAGS